MSRRFEENRSWCLDKIKQGKSGVGRRLGALPHQAPGLSSENVSQARGAQRFGQRIHGEMAGLIPA
jgi:hypothetical protein